MSKYIVGVAFVDKKNLPFTCYLVHELDTLEEAAESYVGALTATFVTTFFAGLGFKDEAGNISNPSEIMEIYHTYRTTGIDKLLFSSGYVKILDEVMHAIAHIPVDSILKDPAEFTEDRYNVYIRSRGKNDTVNGMFQDYPAIIFSTVDWFEQKGFLRNDVPSH